MDKECSTVKDWSFERNWIRYPSITNKESATGLPAILGMAWRLISHILSEAIRIVGYFMFKASEGALEVIELLAERIYTQYYEVDLSLEYLSRLLTGDAQ